jgi:hypothetical protein
MRATLTVLGLILAVVIAGSTLFGAQWLGLEWYGFFSKKKQNIEREVFENTKSYVHGAQQELARYYGQYQKAKTEDEKAAIANVIKFQYASLDLSKLENQQLAAWVKQIRGF